MTIIEQWWIHLKMRRTFRKLHPKKTKGLYLDKIGSLYGVSRWFKGPYIRESDKRYRKRIIQAAKK